MARPLVEVVGLKAFTADLARSADDRKSALLKEMKQAGRTAMNPIADAARGAVPHDSGRVGSPGHMTLEDNIRVSSTRTGAAVRAGQKGKVEHAGWIEFGGTRRRPHDSARVYISGGRFLFPAARRLTQTAKGLYEDAIARAYDHYQWTNPTADPGAVHD